MKLALRYWREIALVATVALAYAFGRRAAERNAELVAWKDSVAVIRQHAAEALAAFQQERRNSAAAAVDLDSARAAWRRTLEAWRPQRPRLDWTGLGPASTPPSVPSLVVAGDALDRACMAYETACERAQAAAQAAIDSLRQEIAFIDRRPPEPAARRLQPFVAGGWGILDHDLALRAGIDLRLWGDWRLIVDAERRLAPSDTIRLGLWIRRSF